MSDLAIALDALRELEARSAAHMRIDTFGYGPHDGGGHSAFASGHYLTDFGTLRFRVESSVEPTEAWAIISLAHALDEALK